MSIKHVFPLDPILVVDDEVSALDSFEISLYSAGFSNVITCNDSRKVMEILRGRNVELVFLDLIMPFVSGEQLIVEIKKEFPEICVIVVTAVGDIDTVVECIRNGATDYLLKPVEKAHLKNRVLKSLEMRELQQENAALRERLLNGRIEHAEFFREIVTQNVRMLSIFQYCESIARSSYPILITGKTGTGKELIAKAIHGISGRSGELVAVNIAAFDDTLFADTLFGHVKGAFTGADERRKGLVETANGGTLFLDEIGDLSNASQTKLLRLLQEREYSPVGSDTKKNANIRIIASTNKDLKELRKAEKFRDDLYYRLVSHHVHLPPLREKPDDIRLLLDHFLEETSQDMDKPIPTYHPELINLLKCYHFPGNIRELKHLVADAVAKHKRKMLSSVTFKEHIELESDNKVKHNRVPLPALDFESLRFDPGEIPKLKEAMTDLTKALIGAAMKKSGGNQTIAARILGISQQSLSIKVGKLLK
ncbi:MAG: sigma-54-dependent Fis family transcriptional regulator [Desulfobacteraceae bacterium]|nr:sigma-54-dependent Fis family transcriptional regulator [Desulfobacteraceae bacterium]